MSDKEKGEKPAPAPAKAAPQTSISYDPTDLASINAAMLRLKRDRERVLRDDAARVKKA